MMLAQPGSPALLKIFHQAAIIKMANTGVEDPKDRAGCFAL